MRRTVITGTSQVIDFGTSMTVEQLAATVRKTRIPWTKTTFVHERLAGPEWLHVIGRADCHNRLGIVVCVGENLDEIGINWKNSFSRIVVAGICWNGDVGLTPNLFLQYHEIVRQFCEMFAEVAKGV